MPGRLVRFRADPSKLHVAICHVGERFGMEGDWYRARVYTSTVYASRLALGHRILISEFFDPTPEVALIGALEDACKPKHIDGVDLGMERTYRHPWLDP